MKTLDAEKAIFLKAGHRVSDPISMADLMSDREWRLRKYTDLAKAVHDRDPVEGNKILRELIERDGGDDRTVGP